MLNQFATGSAGHSSSREYNYVPGTNMHINSSYSSLLYFIPPVIFAGLVALAGITLCCLRYCKCTPSRTAEIELQSTPIENMERDEATATAKNKQEIPPDYQTLTAVDGCYETVTEEEEVDADYQTVTEVDDPPAYESCLPVPDSTSAELAEPPEVVCSVLPPAPNSNQQPTQ